MRNKVLKKWKGNILARERWSQFLDTPEFEAGFKLLEAHAVPVYYPGEDNDTVANRHAYMAGFHQALSYLSRMDELHTPTVQKEMPEWDQDYILKVLAQKLAQEAEEDQP